MKRELSVKVTLSQGPRGVLLLEARVTCKSWATDVDFDLQYMEYKYTW